MRNIIFRILTSNKCNPPKYLYSFLTTALEGDEGSASRPGRSLPPGNTRYQLYRSLGGSQARFGQVRKISPPPGFDPRTVQTVASRYTDWAPRPTNNTVNPPLPQIPPLSVTHVRHLRRRFYDRVVIVSYRIAPSWTCRRRVVCGVRGPVWNNDAVVSYAILSSHWCSCPVEKPGIRHRGNWLAAAWVNPRLRYRPTVFFRYLRPFLFIYAPNKNSVHVLGNFIHHNYHTN